MAEKDIHYYEPANGHGLKYDPFNAIVAPRPIGWISSRDAKGNINLAPYSFFNAFCYKPPIVGFSSTSWKDSVSKQYEDQGNSAGSSRSSVSQQINATDHDRDLKNRLATLVNSGCQSKIVRVPRVAESPVSFECRLSEIVQLKRADGGRAEAWLTLGEVVAVHIDKAFINEGVYQTALARPIARAGRRGSYFEIRPDAMFEMPRPD